MSASPRSAFASLEEWLTELPAELRRRTELWLRRNPLSVLAVIGSLAFVLGVDPVHADVSGAWEALRKIDFASAFEQWGNSQPTEAERSDLELVRQLVWQLVLIVYWCFAWGFCHPQADEVESWEGLLPHFLAWWLATLAKLPRLPLLLLKAVDKWPPGWRIRRSVGAALLIGAGLSVLVASAIGYAMGSALGFALLAAVFGIWLVQARFANGQPGPWTEVMGAALSMLLVSAVCGTLLYILCAADQLSWRYYTLWAAQFLTLAVVLLARSMDALGNGLSSRLVLGFGLVIAFLAVLAAPVDIGNREALWTEDHAAALEREATKAWFDGLEGQLCGMEEGPVIVVAAAGGGSRAALFATLVLEALAMEPDPLTGQGGRPTLPAKEGRADLDCTGVDKPKGQGGLADRVLFVSSVSGGSVASAHWLFSVQSEDDGSTGQAATTAAQRAAAVDGTLGAKLRAAIIPEEHVANTTLNTRSEFIRENARLARAYIRVCGAERRRFSEEVDSLRPELFDRRFEDASRAEAWKVLADPEEGGEESAGVRPLDYASAGDYLLGTVCRRGARLGSLRFQRIDGSFPLDSKRFDQLGEDFTGPLLRGMVLPGMERGESMSGRWERKFQWNRGYLGELNKPAPDADDSFPRTFYDKPYLLVNLTDVERGTRVVAGFPPLPSKVLGARAGATGGAETSRMGAVDAKSMTDLDPSLRVSVEEAVRMSANFPWGFDIPYLGLPDTPRGDRVRVVDGGVLDNTGIDSIYQLLRGLERLERASGPKSARSRSLLQELARRGVVLLEIDSGAKPVPPSSLKQEWLGNVFLPVHSLSMSGFVRASDATSSNAERIDSVLRRYDIDDFRNGPNWHRRLEHVVFALDTTDIITAWGLTDAQKGRLLGRFTYEWEVQHRSIRSAILDLQATARIRSQVSQPAKGKPPQWVRPARKLFRALMRDMTRLFRFDRAVLSRGAELRAREPKDNRLLGYPNPGRSTRSSGWMPFGYFPRGCEAEAERWFGTLLATGEHEGDCAPVLTYLDFDFQLLSAGTEMELRHSRVFELKDPAVLRSSQPSAGNPSCRPAEPWALWLGGEPPEAQGRRVCVDQQGLAGACPPDVSSALPLCDVVPATSLGRGDAVRPLELRQVHAGSPWWFAKVEVLPEVH